MDFYVGLSQESFITSIILLNLRCLFSWLNLIKLLVLRITVLSRLISAESAERIQHWKRKEAAQQRRSSAQTCFFPFLVLKLVYVLTRNALGLLVLSSLETEELRLSRREAGMKSRLERCSPMLPTFDHIMYQIPTAEQKETISKPQSKRNKIKDGGEKY